MKPLELLLETVVHLGTMVKIGSSVKELQEFNLYIEKVILSLTDEECETPQFDKCQEIMKNNLTLLQEFYLTN